MTLLASLTEKVSLSAVIVSPCPLDKKHQTLPVPGGKRFTYHSQSSVVNRLVTHLIEFSEGPRIDSCESLSYTADESCLPAASTKAG